MFSRGSKGNVKDIDSGNVGIRDEDVDDSDESTGGISCTDAYTRVAKLRYVEPKRKCKPYWSRR